MKKFISSFLSLILILSVFTACSNSSKDEKESAQLKFTIDSHYSNTDESALRAYEKLCNAVVNGDSEVKFNVNMIDDVYNLFYTSFPLFSLVDNMNVLSDSSGVELTYKNAIDEHKQIVSQFTDKISEIMTACQYGKVSNDRYIFNVYTYITSNFSVDNSVFTLIDILANGKGYSASLCSLFEYLVLQGGGQASHIIDVSSSSIISAVVFKGQWYYFNPAKDIEKNQGKALTGFAMNNARTGSRGFSYTDDIPVVPATDETFFDLENSSSFEDEGSKVNIKCSNDNIFVLEFN